MSLPTLYATKPGSTRRRQWRVWTERTEIFVEWGMEKGKLQLSRSPTTATAKNSGKKNATNPTDQATKEARRMWIAKLDRGYAPDRDGMDLYNTVIAKKQSQQNSNLGADSFEVDKNSKVESSLQNVLVMKGVEWSKVKNKKFPYACQPKMDGIHCIAQWSSKEKRAVLMSRMCKQHHPSVLKHIVNLLTTILQDNKDMILAGELYSHSPPDLEKGQSPLQYVQKRCAINRKSPHSCEKYIRFYIYDQIPRDPSDAISFKARYRAAIDAVRPHLSAESSVALTSTKIAKTEEEVSSLYEKWVGEGYEGAMLKQVDSPYKRDSRNNNMIKVKPEFDREETVIGTSEAEGNHKGCIMFHLESDDGVKHMCTPKATLEQRQKWYVNRKRLLGKRVTVKYYGLTQDNVPIFSNVIAIRDYE